LLPVHRAARFSPLAAPYHPSQSDPDSGFELSQYSVTAPLGTHVLVSQGLGQADQEQGDFHASLIYR